jgi:hypothetical protein
MAFWAQGSSSGGAQLGSSGATATVAVSYVLGSSALCFTMHPWCVSGLMAHQQPQPWALQD